MGVGPFVRRRRAARGGACAVVEVPFVSCERFLALGQRRAGAERVNPLPDAVPSSRPLRLARARAALWDAVGRFARARWRLGRAPSRCGPVCLFLWGVLLKRGSPVPLFVRLVPTTRYKESSWVPWSGCIVVNPPSKLLP